MHCVAAIESLGSYLVADQCVHATVLLLQMKPFHAWLGKQPAVLHHHHLIGPLLVVQDVGTFHWMAPELIAAGRCTEKADIFSFGVVLYEIVSAEQPIRGLLKTVKYATGICGMCCAPSF